MVTIDSGIVLDFPDSWERFTEGSRCVFHTGRREEIIVSATRISGDSPAGERAQAMVGLFANGLVAARRGASAPDLKLTKPLAEESGVCVFRCATVLAETIARERVLRRGGHSVPTGCCLSHVRSAIRRWCGSELS